LDNEWAGASLQADFAVSAIDNWLRMALDTQSAVPPEGAWRQAALHHACQWLTDTLGATGRGQAVIRASQTATPWRPASARHSLLMTVQHQDAQGLVTETLHGLLHVDALGLLLSVGLLPTAAPEENSLAAPEIPIPLYFGVGETDLTVAQLRELQPADVVFFSRTLMTRDEVLTLRTESTQGPWWTVSARLEYTNLHILQGAQIMTANDIPSEDTPEEAVNNAPFEIHEVPIRISFDLGHTSLTLGKLQSLQTGEVLNLARTVDEYVTIRANGSAIGTGQLVDIDGRLGVSISKLHAPLPLAADQEG
jgi:type III secretion protein Q